MPAYKLKSIIEEVAKEREIKLYGSHEDFIREISHELESKTITAKEAVEKLQENKDFRMHFSDEDFSKIESVIK